MSSGTGLTDLTRHDILPQMEPATKPIEGPRIAALWVAVLALLAGGVFGAISLAGDGAESPEEAAQQMFDAIAGEDMLGVLESLAPSERGPYRDNLPDMVDELKRLGILSGDASLSDVKGLDLSFEDLRFTSRQLGEGVSSVTIASGKVSFRVVPRDLPLGDFVKDLIGEDLPAEAQTGSEAVASGDDAGLDLVAVHEGGRWYVSLHYSLAEEARRSSGAPVPEFGKGLQADGEDSPEKAVEALIRAGAALDVQRAIELLPPDEARALRDYAPLFIDDAKQAAADTGFKASVTSLELETKRNGGRATVDVKRFALAFEMADARGTVSFDGECVTMSGPDVPAGEGRICPEDQGGPQALTDLASRMPTQGFVTVEQDGEWYVSPSRTVLESVVGALEALQRSDLDELRDSFSGFAVEESTPVG